MSDRRSFLSGLASLPFIGGGAASALAGTPGLGGLWHRLMLAQGVLTQASARLSAAEAQMPWWAKPGPIYIGHDGTMSGPVRGWPAIENHPLPEREGSFQIIRIGPEEIERRHERRCWFTSAARAQELRVKDEAGLKARYARKAVEEQALGIPALVQANDDAFDMWNDLAEAIEGLPDGLTDVTAAKILIEMHRFVSTDATITSNTAVALAAVALRGLLPHLEGALAIDAADVLADPNRPMREMRISRGILPNGEVAEAGAA